MSSLRTRAVLSFSLITVPDSIAAYMTIWDYMTEEMKLEITSNWFVLWSLFGISPVLTSPDPLFLKKFFSIGLGFTCMLIVGRLYFLVDVVPRFLFSWWLLARGRSHLWEATFRSLLCGPLTTWNSAYSSTRVGEHLSDDSLY